MYYGLILSVDTEKKDIDLDFCQPVPIKEWHKEEDEKSEYECFKDGWHYTWSALLDQEQLDAFMEKTEFSYLCNTGGAIGMPQPDGDCCLGCLSAFAVETRYQDALVCAYITPYIMQGQDENVIPALKLHKRKVKELAEGDWDIIMDWFRDKYNLT